MTRTTGHSAEANAYALRLVVSPDGAGKTVVELGRAYSRIADGVPSGVFRSQMSALDVNIADVLTFGNVSTQTLPCEGTGGKVKSKNVALAGVPNVLELSAIKYSWTGKQLAKGKAKSFVQTQIGNVNVLNRQVEVHGLISRLGLRSPGRNQEVKRNATAKFGQIKVGGAVVNPKPGQSIAFDGGSRMFRKLQNTNYNGSDLFGLVITLFEENLVIHLGEASGRIFYR